MIALDKEEGPGAQKARPPNLYCLVTQNVVYRTPES